MMEPSYSYAERSGILPISWNDFHALSKGLAAAIEPYQPELILGIARGGLYPAGLLAQLLQVELYPIRLTRRLNDAVVRARPRWLIRPPAAVQGRRVLIVDEVCDSGETLRLSASQTRRRAAAEVRTAVLYSHLRAQEVPDYIGILSDRLFLNPWDREILRDGQFILHPEYAGALSQQGAALTEDLLPGIPARAPEKAARD